MSTLIEELDYKLDKLSNLDPAWVIFITDHTNNIISESETTVITEADRDRFKFKIDHLLRDRDVHQSIHWIVKLINGLNMYETLATKEFLYLPDRSMITDLYRVYRTTNKLKT